MRSVELRGAVRLQLTVGAASASIRGGEEALKATTVVLANGVLRIAHRDTDTGDESVQVELRLPTIPELHAADASRAEVLLGACDGACPTLVVEAGGAADIRAEGQVRQATVIATGAGQVRLRHLKADAVEVDVAGAARVVVGPTATLKVRGGGVGQVRYVGTPVVDSDVASTVKVGPATARGRRRGEGTGPRDDGSRGERVNR